MSKPQLQVSQERIKSKYTWKPGEAQILEKKEDVEVNLKRNKKTGEVLAYENGKKIGSVLTMGDMIDGKDD